jgi:hypothetical protein
LDKYPGYATWLQTLIDRDNAFTFLIVISAIVLLWMLYSRTIFKRLENISRPAVVVVLYTAIVAMQFILGNGLPR